MKSEAKLDELVVALGAAEVLRLVKAGAKVDEKLNAQQRRLVGVR